MILSSSSQETLFLFLFSNTNNDSSSLSTSSSKASTQLPPLLNPFPLLLLFTVESASRFVVDISSIRLCRSLAQGENF